nr:MAG TPA: hypothetical protein [Caudoviricetes sp.]
MEIFFSKKIRNLKVSVTETLQLLKFFLISAF